MNSNLHCKKIKLELLSLCAQRKPKANSLHGCVNLSVVSNRERCRPPLALLAPLEEGAHVGKTRQASCSDAPCGTHACRISSGHKVRKKLTGFVFFFFAGSPSAPSTSSASSSSRCCPCCGCSCSGCACCGPSTGCPCCGWASSGAGFFRLAPVSTTFPPQNLYLPGGGFNFWTFDGAPLLLGGIGSD